MSYDGKSGSMVSGCRNPDRDMQKPRLASKVLLRRESLGGLLAHGNALASVCNPTNMAGGERYVQRATLKSFDLSRGRFRPPGCRSVTDVGKRFQMKRFPPAVESWFKPRVKTMKSKMEKAAITAARDSVLETRAVIRLAQFMVEDLTNGGFSYDQHTALNALHDVSRALGLSLKTLLSAEDLLCDLEEGYLELFK